ncbi:MAG: SRPBCC family protein [Kofleriaceae bacterium]
MRSLLMGLVLGSMVVGGGTAFAGTQVTVIQPADQAMTEGEVVVDGDPAALYALAQDYAKWTEIMPDVAKVEIREHKGVDARVTLVAPNGHRDNLHFHNQPQANLIFFEDTGNGGRADVWGEIVFAPAARSAQTRVHIRLYAKLHGVATLVVSDRQVRERREHEMTADLTHMREYFRRRVADR